MKGWENNYASYHFQQLNLFEPAEKLTQLYTAIDWVKTKYGAGKLVKAQGF